MRFEGNKQEGRIEGGVEVHEIGVVHTDVDGYDIDKWMKSGQRE